MLPRDVCQPTGSLSSLGLLLPLLLLHLLLDDTGCLFRRDFFEHILDLKDTLVVDGLVDVRQKRFISDHALGELHVRDCGTAEVIDDILDQDQGAVLHIFTSLRLGHQDLHNGLNRRKRERR